MRGVSDAAPRLTIGLPVYNGGPVLRTTIESLLSQTFRDFVLLISDNASTDETEAICREFAARDARVRYVRQPTNLRMHPNFEFVLAEAKSELFMWAAADDGWDNDWLKCLVGHMTPGVAAAFGRCVLTASSGDPVRCFPAPRWSKSAFWRAVQYFLVNEANGKSCLIYGVLRRDVICRYPVTRYEYHGGDYLLVFDLLQEHACVVDESVVFWKGDHPRQRTSKLTRLRELVGNFLRLFWLNCRYPWHAQGILLKACLAGLLPLKIALAAWNRLPRSLAKDEGLSKARRAGAQTTVSPATAGRTGGAALRPHGACRSTPTSLTSNT